MKKKFLVVLVPHFSPDTAPTGEVISTLVEEFVEKSLGEMKIK